MQFSLAAGLGKLFSKFISNGKKYGVEWWILVFGAVVILSILFMAIFAMLMAVFWLGPAPRVFMVGILCMQMEEKITSFGTCLRWGVFCLFPTLWVLS